jgi:hypothetical protein
MTFRTRFVSVITLNVYEGYVFVDVVNSLPGSITGLPCSRRSEYGSMALEIGGISYLGQNSLVMSPAERRPERECVAEAQQQTRPLIRVDAHNNKPLAV